jgi:hypothetical protein
MFNQIIKDQSVSIKKERENYLRLISLTGKSSGIPRSPLLRLNWVCVLVKSDCICIFAINLKLYKNIDPQYAYFQI